MFGAFFLNIFVAPVKLAKISGKIYLTGEKTSRWWPYATMYIPLFTLCIMFGILQMKCPWSWSVALFIYLTFCGCAAAIRMHAREKLRIEGHILQDFLACFFLYPSVIVQLEWTLKQLDDDTLKSNTYHFNHVIIWTNFYLIPIKVRCLNMFMVLVRRLFWPVLLLYPKWPIVRMYLRNVPIIRFAKNRSP